ncbi:hypothetical protein PoB_006561200 [Plakobranchus ocellatus]|uniref:Uncharacterized protein n=1 Tax=Plakobranchus ocellatus TaxID=259542 RepID=A0AAV4D4G4_9GAST|nr:hypothetical protein PoB_006561200 [Plakobranchus ocellatus]
MPHHSNTPRSILWRLSYGDFLPSYGERFYFTERPYLVHGGAKKAGHDLKQRLSPLCFASDENEIGATDVGDPSAHRVTFASLCPSPVHKVHVKRGSQTADLWRKKANSRVSDKTSDREQRPEFTGPSSSGTPPTNQFHSLQTQKWVRGTPDIIEIYPESTTYDQDSFGYLVIKGSQAYPQIDATPTGEAGRPEASTIFNKRAVPMPYGKQLRKSQSIHNLSLQTSSELSSPNIMDSRLPPKPHKLESKGAVMQKWALLPSVHNQHHQLKSPKGSTQQEQTQTAQEVAQYANAQDTQTAQEVAQYANTRDLMKLKGNVRKMFPIL